VNSGWKQATIRRIEDSDWEQILAVQESAFPYTPCETGSVLKSKWDQSPDTCLCCVQEDGQLLAYLLAHPWHKDSSPALFAELTSVPESRNLFVHDLAVSASVQGRGMGSALLRKLIATALDRGYETMTLVAVKGAGEFWSGQGFFERQHAAVDASYGEGAICMERVLTSG
jgi:predicted N-acetyltransferase YhbS